MDKPNENLTLPQESSLLIPTRYSVETLTVGKGSFIICSAFCGQGTIAYELAKRMLADVHEGLAIPPEEESHGQP